MSVVRPHCVYLDIEAISLQELFIDVWAFLTDLSALCRWKELRTVIISFAEQDIVASTAWALGAVVDFDLMVLCVDRFLHIGLIETLPIDDQIVLILLDAYLLVFIQELIFLMALETEVLFIGWPSKIWSNHSS
jgi:hypothetical protein